MIASTSHSVKNKSALIKRDHSDVTNRVTCTPANQTVHTFGLKITSQIRQPFWEEGEEDVVGSVNRKWCAILNDSCLRGVWMHMHACRNGGGRRRRRRQGAVDNSTSS